MNAGSLYRCGKKARMSEYWLGSEVRAMSALGPDFLQVQTFAGTTSRQQAPERCFSAMLRAQAIAISVVRFEPPVVGDLLVEAFTLQ